jgi:membrane protein
MPDLALRCLRRFLQIEGTQHAAVLAAQAFTSFFPFLIVAAALGPGDDDLAERIVERFGLEGQSASSVGSLFAESGEVEGALTLFSVLVLVLAMLSFSRTMQHMFQRAYGREPDGIKDAALGVAWLVGLGVWIAIVSPLRQALEDVGGVVFAIALGTATGCVLWLWTPLILLRARDWRRLLPGAVVSGVLGALLSVASEIYIPIVMNSSAERYGLIGIVFTLQSWLLVSAFLVVFGAVVGALVTESRTRERV